MNMHPIDALARRLATGEVNAAEALQQARAPELASTLNHPLILTLTETAHRLRCAGRWRDAIRLMQVLLTVTEAAPVGVVPGATRDSLIRVWVECVALALWHATDPRLYRQALKLGEQAAASSRARGDQALLGEILRALGAIHLEPFSRHRSVDEAVRREWARRLYEGDTWDGERDPTAPEGAFPEQAAALRMAGCYLREAVEVCKGYPRALAMHSLVTALALSDPPAVSEIVAIGQEALGLLEVHNDTARMVEMAGRLQAAGAEVNYEIIGRVMALPWDQLQKRHGTADAINLLLNAALVLEAAGKAAEVLEALLRSGTWLASVAEGELRHRWLLRLRSALRNAFLEGPLPPAAGTVQEALTELQQRAANEGWTPSRCGAALLALAERSPTTNEELLGIPLLNRVEEIPPFNEHPLALRALRGQLWWSAASRLAREKPDEALVCYAQALGDAIEVANPAVAQGILTEVARTVASATAPGLAALVASLTSLARRIELLLGEMGTKRLQDVAAAASLRLVRDVRDSALMHDFLRLAKGVRFAAVLTSGAARDYRMDASARAILSKIQSLLASADNAQPTTEATDTLHSYGELLLVSPQVEAGIHLGGKTAAETLANLQHQFDLQLERNLSSRASDEHLPALSAAALPHLLNAETVLIEYYLTHAGDAEFLVLLLRSTEGTRLGAVQLGKATSQRTLVFEGIVAELSEIAATVLTLRKAVNEAPFAAPLSPAGEEKLTGTTGLFLGELPAVLAELRAQGKRHLCIVPNGALHVAPLHLLLIDGRPLAEDWLVTYLPNLSLAVSRDRDRASSSMGGRPLTAIGLTFTQDNPFQLPTLENVRSEIQAVAEIGKVPPLLDNQATKRAILEALEQSRAVHLATHGAHNPFAASFQCLYCARGDGGDGRLFAHELLGRDLRGLDLVTLSACETALGRFDFGDNLRGLPAALFLAGARTIIGTLWDLETNAAETFFTALYAASQRGAGKLAAFGEAQRLTRTRHPEFRDWGAFYFAGDWR